MPALLVRRLSAFSLVVVLGGCKPVPATIDVADTPPPARAREGSKGRKPAEFDVAVALDGAEQALLTVDELRTRPGPNSYDDGEMHSYLPDEGLRSLYYYATVANLSVFTIGALFETSVFASGPHDESPNFYVTDQFGHYNPEFVDRLAMTARALGRDPARVERTREAFDRQLRDQARTYLGVYLALHRDPNFYAEYKAAYLAIIADPNAEFVMSDSAVAINESFRNNGLSWYEADTAGFFWVRRELDGTDQLWVAALQALLDAYGVDGP